MDPLRARTFWLPLAAAFFWLTAPASAVAIDWMPVTDPGNACETQSQGCFGAVDYLYKIGKYEVTNAQYAEFLNSVATVSDPYGLYDTDMGGGWNDIGGISRSGSGTGSDPWVYAARPNRGNRPVNYVDWYDTLRFANWMHNGQGSGDTEDGAYDMSLGSGVVRKPGARVFLPTEDEWYKAAYYKGGGTDAGYWDYPTQSDTAPTSEAPPGTDMTNGSGNYYGAGYAIGAPYYQTEVGAYSAKPSDSTYGTFDQGGNVWEWNEALIVGFYRGVRGGAFDSADTNLWAGPRAGLAPTYEYIFNVGFRVAAVPEPGTLSLLALGGVLVARRRR
jgi:sulfatase modifying factor 1